MPQLQHEDERENMSVALDEAASRHPDRTFCLFDGEAITYGEMARRAGALAAGLAADGVRKGDPVLIATGNRLEMPLLYFALARLGALAVPVNTALRGDTLRHLLSVTGARFAIAEPEWIGRMDEALGDAGRPDRLYVTDRWETQPRTLPFPRLLESQDAVPDVDAVAADPWGIMFTSGTTGQAKGVVLTQKQMMSAAYDAAFGMTMDERSVIYTFNPLFHMNGLIYGPLAALVSGARSVVRGEFPKAALLDELRAIGATHWTATAFTMRGLMDQPRRADDREMALRDVLGYGCTIEEIRAFEDRFGCRVHGGYGSTETGLVCRTQAERPDTAGRVSERFEIRIVGPDGDKLPANALGELWARARDPRDRMIGYFRDEAATRAAFVDGWYRTGDRGLIDDEGYFHFGDRLKDSLKRRGENISAQEVEGAIRSFPGVLGAAVVGFRPDARGEEEVRAFVEMTPEALQVASAEALLRHCEKNLAYFMLPRFIDFVASLPRSPIGKVEKGKLKDMAMLTSTIDAKLIGFAASR